MALFKFGFVWAFLIYTRPKLHVGKNQKLPFYNNKGFNAHFLAHADLETSTESHVGVNEPCTQNESFSQYHSMSLLWRTGRNLYDRNQENILLAASQLVFAETA